MKIRNGFVSNSSSSSFVVRRGTDWGYGNSKIPKSKEQKLEKYGFRRTTAHSPDQVPGFYDNGEWQKTDEFLEKPEFKNAYNYGYEVTCNQDTVIQFLIKNKISFVASCHYGHESVIYNADEDKVYIGNNFGSILEMHSDMSDVELDYYMNRKPIAIMSGKEWLSKNK